MYFVRLYYRLGWLDTWHSGHTSEERSSSHRRQDCSMHHDASRHILVESMTLRATMISKYSENIGKFFVVKSSVLTILILYWSSCSNPSKQSWPITTPCPSHRSGNPLDLGGIRMNGNQIIHSLLDLHKKSRPWKPWQLPRSTDNSHCQLRGSACYILVQWQAEDNCSSS